MALQDLTPQLRTRLSRVERLVGLFVGLATLLLAAGFLYYGYHTAQRKGWFVTKATYFTFVDGAAGLKVGDPVKLMGFEVGQITRIDAMDPFASYNVYVEFQLRDPYYGYMWTDSRARVTPADFLGKRTLEVTKGTNGLPTYFFHPIYQMTVQDALERKDIQTRVFAGDVKLTNRLVLARPPEPVTRELLQRLDAHGRTAVRVADPAGNTTMLDVARALQTGTYSNRVCAEEVEDISYRTLAEVWKPVTPATLQALAAAGIETIRVADYFHKARPVPLKDALEWEASAYANHVFIDEVRDPRNGQLLAGIAQPLSFNLLARIAEAGLTTVRVAERRPPTRRISGMYLDKLGCYEPYTNRVHKYWLLSDESPALTETAEALLAQVKEGLPGFLQLTNQLATVLNNAIGLTVQLDAILSNALPVVTNVAGLASHADELLADLKPSVLHLQSITSLLTNAQGSLGDWLIPTNLNAQLQITLGNLNLGLTQTLANVAALSSNLNAQLQVNTNFLSQLSALIVDTDDLIQGLKRHWLLRSAFKPQKTNPPPVQPRPKR